MTESNTPTDTPQYQKRDRAKKPWIITVVVLAAIVAIAAAVFWLNRDTGGGATDPEQGNGNGGNGGSPSTSSELIVGLQLAPDNLDIRTTGGVALDQILIDNAYQGLIGLASGSVDDFVPVLAENLPEISDDGLTYTFKLRDGVAFHSGAALTTADVIDSLAAPEGPASLSMALGSPVTASAPDERTVVLQLSSPSSEVLWHLANRPGLIFESAYTGDLASSINGTGPYTLEQWNQGDSITFAANPEYWGDAPGAQTVVWRYIPDSNAAVNAALEGDLDVLAPVNPSLASQFDGSDFNLGRAASTDVFTLGYNSANPKLSDVRVRTALSKAIDSASIVAAFYGDGKELGGPITDIEPAYEDLTSINAYDPEVARALLDEAGAAGLALTLTIPNFYELDAINQVVTQFAEVGVTLTIDQVEFTTWLSSVYAGHDFELSYVNHAEPNDFANYANPGYYFGYDNPEVQALFAQSVASTDAGKAIELRKQAARLVAEDAPAKWLINYTPTNAVASHVEGFPSSNTNSRINLAGVTVG